MPSSMPIVKISMEESSTGQPIKNNASPYQLTWESIVLFFQYLKRET